MKKYFNHRILLLVIVVVILSAFYSFFKYTGFTDLITDTAQFKLYIIELGNWGIVLIILLMAFAILFKLLPSAAVALGSGAVYGHTWGTIYIITGAWIGAIIAFSITRLLGKDVLRRISEHLIFVKWEQEQSQSLLMWGLFISRLIPVIPYDIVSYIMGLTPLKLWRFSIATLIGVIPTSFFLAHVGGELAEINFKEMLSGMMTAGFVLLFPLAIFMAIYYRYPKIRNLFFTRFLKIVNKKS